MAEFVPIKPYTKAELASFWGIRTQTLKRWIKRAGLLEHIPDYDNSTTIFAPQVALIFEKIGHPEKEDVKPR